MLGFWLGDARQTNPAAFAQIEPDFNQDDLFKGVNDLGWSETSGDCTQLLLQTDPETVAQKGDQDVGFDPSLESEEEDEDPAALPGPDVVVEAGEEAEDDMLA